MFRLRPTITAVVVLALLTASATARELSPIDCLSSFLGSYEHLVKTPMPSMTEIWKGWRSEKWLKTTLEQKLAGRIRPEIIRVGQEAVQITPLSEAKIAPFDFEWMRPVTPLEPRAGSKRFGSVQDPRKLAIGERLQDYHDHEWTFVRKTGSSYETDYIFEDTQGRTLHLTAEDFGFEPSRFAKPTTVHGAYRLEAKIALADGKEHTIEVIVTKDRTVLDIEAEIADLKSTLGLLPQLTIRATKRIIFPPMHGVFHESFVGEKTMGRAIRSSIMIFDTDSGSFVQTLLHEHAHQVASRIWKNSDFPSPLWDRAISLDKKRVSNYARKDAAEDFAETFEYYLRTEGGKLDRRARREFSNRFRFLDELLDPAKGPELDAGFWGTIQDYYLVRSSLDRKRKWIFQVASDGAVFVLPLGVLGGVGLTSWIATKAAPSPKPSPSPSPCAQPSAEPSPTN